MIALGCVLRACFAAACLCEFGAAQTISPAATPTTTCGIEMAEATLHHLEDCARVIFTNETVHAALAQLAPGSGVGIGLGSQLNFNKHDGTQQWFSSQALVATSGAWKLDAAAIFGQKLAADGSEIQRERFGVSAHAYTNLGFFGLGPTAALPQASFGEHDITGFFTWDRPLTPWLTVGAGFESQRIGAANTTPSALGTLPAASVSNAQVYLVPEVHLRFVEPNPHRRVNHQYRWDDEVSLSDHRDTGGGAFSFWRLDAVGEHIPWRGGVDDRYLLIRGRLVESFTGAGSSVPFLLQPTLGGTDAMGFDTVRGLADYRYRGPDMFVLQPELRYRFVPSLPVVGAVFYDCGKVALRPGDLNFSQLQQSAGVGIGIATPIGAIRAYVALAGAGKSHVFIGFGDGVYNPSETDAFDFR